MFLYFPLAKLDQAVLALALRVGVEGGCWWMATGSLGGPVTMAGLRWRWLPLLWRQARRSAHLLQLESQVEMVAPKLWNSKFCPIKIMAHLGTRQPEAVEVDPGSLYSLR